MSLAPVPLSPQRSRLLNALGLLAVCAVLAFAFFDQLVGGEVPCPLCILQRAGFAAVGFGLALNLRFGPRPSHYGVAMLSALATGAVAARQVLLHIVPGTGSYGAALLGLHFYSWTLVLSLVILAGCALLLMFDRQFEAPAQGVRASGVLPLALGALVLITLLTLGNGVSTVLECGGGLCADDPHGYQMLEGPAATP